MKKVKIIELTKIRQSEYKAQFVGCLILTKDHKILLQQRGHDFVSHPDYLCEFGGHIEEEEEPTQAIIRELKEELGASVREHELISLGAITEKTSNHTELVYTYFWHDVDGTITGCYEGEARYFGNIASILSYPKLTDGLRWLLQQCQRKGLLILEKAP